jgi:hypothetical protein
MIWRAIMALLAGLAGPVDGIDGSAISGGRRRSPPREEGRELGAVARTCRIAAQDTSRVSLGGGLDP